MFQSESEKIRPLVKQYCGAITLDVGCGHDKIIPEAIGVDHREHEAVSFKIFEPSDAKYLTKFLPDLEGECDAVYSGHYLGFISEDFKALKEWTKFLKIGGYMILYLPDYEHFDIALSPGNINKYTYKSFMPWFRSHVKNMVVIHCGQDLGEDKYSFYVIARRVE